MALPGACVEVRGRADGHRAHIPKALRGHERLCSKALSDDFQRLEA